jgi:hypothetical protein
MNGETLGHFFIIFIQKDANEVDEMHLNKHAMVLEERKTI